MFLNLELDEVYGQLHTTAALPLEEPLVLTGQRGGWAWEVIWVRVAKKKNSLYLQEIKSQPSIP